MASSLEFLVEDDDTAYVSYLPQDAWQSWNGSNYHAGSYHVTKVPGAFVTFVFTGTYVAYYSDRKYNHAEYTVLLDGESVFNGTSLAPSLARQELLFSTSVPQGTHTLTVRNAGDPGLMGVDYFVYHALLATPPSSSGSAPIQDTTPTQERLTSTADASSSTIATQAASASTADPPQSPLPTSYYPAHPTVGTGAIVGSALAGGALLLLLIGVAVLVARRRRDGRALEEAQPVSLPAPLPPPYSESSALSPSLPRGKVERAALQ